MESALVPIEVKITADRKSCIYMMRKSYAEVFKNMSDDMVDACNEIEMGFNCVAGQLGFPNNDLSHVRGGMNEGFQDWSLIMGDKVRGWREEVSIKLTDAVLDYVVFGKTFKQIAFERDITRQTASKRFYEGLNEYCDMYFK